MRLHHQAIEDRELAVIRRVTKDDASWRDSADGPSIWNTFLV